MKVINKKNKDNNVNQSSDKNISIWQIFACFIIVNLIIINIVNYWQPLNKKATSLQYNQTQNALVAVYDLQRHFNDFKNQPDNNSFVLIQKSIKLINNIESLEADKKTVLSEDTVNLNKTIALISSRSPSFKVYQQQIEKILKINKDLKQENLDNLELIKNNPVTNNSRVNHQADLNRLASIFDLVKNLNVTSDKINNLVLILKYNFWLSEENVAKYQSVIEEIGLEIEQINNYIQVTNTRTNINNSLITSNLNELFNNLNLLMPMLLEFTEINTQLTVADKYLNHIIENLKVNEALLLTQVNEQNNIDDKTIIIFTLLGATLLLSVLIFLAKATDKTKKVYQDYKNKKEIYLLSHNKAIKTTESSQATNTIDAIDQKKSAEDNKTKQETLEAETVE